MREFQGLSIEEMFDREQDLIAEVAEDDPWSIYKLIKFYKLLISKLTKERRQERYLLDYVKRQLIKRLIWYGEYMKTSDRKDPFTAKQCLKEAISYNRQIPIAHYRLGFLAYQEGRYLNALEHFDMAISQNDVIKEKDYQLNDRQLYYAHLYRSNSALYIADKSHQFLERTSIKGYGQPEGYELSPLYNRIQANEHYISRNAVTVVSKEGERFCSLEEVEEVLNTEHKLICYFGDRENAVYYNGRGVTLQINQAEILRFLLLYSSENRPVTIYDMASIFEPRNPNGELINNTLTVAIMRLRESLASIHFPSDKIQSRRRYGNTGYYYTGDVDYLIIHRTDYDFILKSFMKNSREE